MAEEVQKTEEGLVVTAVPQADDDHKTTTTTTTTTKAEEKPLPETEEDHLKPTHVEENEALRTSGSDDTEKVSFKEEITRVADLPDNEKKEFEELTKLVQEALNKHEFSAVTPAAATAKEEEKKEKVVVAAEAAPAEPVVQEQTAKPQTEIENIEVVEQKVAAVVDDDGAKTVEAIAETIVVVSSSAEQPAAEPKDATSTPEDQSKSENSAMPAEEVSIWGIPLLADERSDVILLKFLRARDFKVKDAFTMLKNTIRWRKEFGIDELVESEPDDDLEKAVFMHGFDKEGHPVCYNVYGEFQNKEIYQKTFSDEEKRQKFQRWRIQYLERSIRKLDFTPGGISTIVQVNDLKNSPGPGKWELRQATKQALQLLQDNYPEFVAKQVFINVPWWYLAVNKMISPFLTQRTKSKFVFAGPAKSTDTLFRYIAAEQVPVKYGGLSKDGEFSATDAVTEIIVKPAAKHTVELPVTEACHLTWEVRVVGWDVNYGAEFVPSSEESYTVIIQKARKVPSTEQPVLCDNFKIGEPGKVVLTIDNATSKKKKLLYRLKTKPFSKDNIDCCA